MDIATPATTREDALARRYGGADAAPAAGPWNDTIALMLNHRSVRGYRPDALPEGTLQTLLAAAQSAATSSNLQCWSVVAVRDPAKKAELARLAGNQKHIDQCPLFLVWLADPSRNARLADAANTTLAGLEFFESFLVSAIDAALAAQNAVLAAQSLGMGTVYIGALRNRPDEVAALLDLPPGCAAVFGLCVGYPAAGAEGEVKPRLPQPVVCHEERYDAANEPALRAGYDQRMADFSKRNEMAQATWSERVIGRLGTMKALNGRDRLFGLLRQLGFPLK